MSEDLRSEMQQWLRTCLREDDPRDFEAKESLALSIQIVRPESSTNSVVIEMIESLVVKRGKVRPLGNSSRVNVHDSRNSPAISKRKRYKYFLRLKI